jgi:hypothetical protein
MAGAGLSRCVARTEMYALAAVPTNSLHLVFTSSQILHDSAQVDFKVDGASAIPAADWLDAEVHRPFDIEHKSPFRVRLLPVEDGYVALRHSEFAYGFHHTAETSALAYCLFWAPWFVSSGFFRHLFTLAFRSSCIMAAGTFLSLRGIISHLTCGR